MLENHVKSTLAAGGFALGVGVGFVRTPSLMRMIAHAGFDFAFIDMEHSAFSVETVNDMCEMARACGIVPIVRPYTADGMIGNRIQDLGAMGLMHFDVTSRAQVERFLQWMRYPPEGLRGQGGGAAFDHERVGGRQALQFVNDNMLLVIQIESVEGIERIDEILAGGGVDVVEVGRGDLSTALGVPGERQHPKVMAAVDTIVAACRRHNVAPGAGPDSREDAQELVRRGVRFLFAGNDRAVLQRAYSDGHQLLSSVIQDAART